jgi:hypothetical protein
MSETNHGSQGIPGDPAESDTFEVIKRPNLLKDKVGSGPILDASGLGETLRAEREAAAERAEQMANSVTDLEEYFWTGRDGGHFDPKRFWSKVGDIREEARALGYPLIDDIGASLGDLLSDVEVMQNRDFKAIGVHISAMRTVVSQNIVGLGGNLGNEVIEALRGMVAHLLKQPQD